MEVRAGVFVRDLKGCVAYCRMQGVVLYISLGHAPELNQPDDGTLLHVRMLGVSVGAS